MTFKNKLICLSTAAAAFLCCSGCVLNGTSIGDNSYIAQTHVSHASTYIADGSIHEQNNSKTEYLSDTYNFSKIINYYTSSISEKELKVFNEICTGIMEYQTEINIDSGVISSDEIGDFLTFLTSACSQIHQLSGNYGLYTDENGFVTGLEMNYSRSKKTGENELASLNEKIAQICEKASSLSDYDKIKYFHDYIVQNCQYDANGENIYSAYGCLIDGKAVCEGYSKAFAMLCEKSGIPCINIMGEASDEKNEVQSHMWNMVNLSECWYHIDVTWDDPKNLFGDDYIRYDYFNVNDDMIKSDHKSITNKYMDYPTAYEINENFFIKQGLYLFDNIDSKSIIEQSVKKCLLNAEKYIRFRCESEDKFQSVINDLFNKSDNNAGFFEILENTVTELGANVSFEEYSIVENNATKVITIQLKEK
ncbi:MAG: hypothetical protein K2F81_05040 [Ruminococcus sp.]|nr:hypothetical protein [Ruminococcus sp.]